MKNEIKQMLLSEDPEVNFLGLMMIEKSNISDIHYFKSCIQRIRYNYPEKFKEMKPTLKM